MNAIAVVCNADDFGMAGTVNRAVVRAHREGILTSASLMANMEGFVEAVRFARECPRLGVGVHMNCLRGRPLSSSSAVGSLLDSNGHFLNRLPRFLLRMARGGIRWKQVEEEWQAQIDRVVAAGVQPTHLDSEKHMHLIVPRLSAIAMRLAVRNRIPFVRVVHESMRLEGRCYGAWRQRIKCGWLNLRSWGAWRLAQQCGIRTPTHFFGVAATGRMTVPYLKTVFGQLRPGIVEVMFHPADGDDAQAFCASFLTTHRQTELETLCDPVLRAFCDERGMHLTHYGALA